MNESIGEDSTEPRKGGFLEDNSMEGGSGQMGYDYNAEEQMEEDFPQQKEQAIKESLSNAKKRSQKSEISVEAETDDYPSRRADRLAENEIGLLFFCAFEHLPLHFIRIVLFVKALDIIFHLLVLGTRSILVQAIFSLLFFLYFQRAKKQRLTIGLVWVIFATMCIQNVFFIVLFIVKLLESTENQQTFYVTYLSMTFFIWLLQNIAWDWQIMDSAELFVTIQAKDLAPPKSLEDSFEKSMPPPQMQTKTKLKKRNTQTE
jgi:hypothetical protein